jgi:hypothetical protein
MSRKTQKTIGFVASLAILGLVGPGAIPTPANAQDEAACRASWKEVCANAKSAPQRRACLQKHEDVLPAECAAVYNEAMVAARGSWRKVHRACKTHFTQGVCKNSGGQIRPKVACLKENADAIDPECTQALDAWEKFDPDA